MGAVVVRLTARTCAGRTGEQPLTARAVSPLAHRWCAGPSSRLAARDPQLAGLRHTRPTLNGWSSRLDRATARFRLDASPASWGSRAPSVLRRAGAMPPTKHRRWGASNAGAFCVWRLPRPSIRPARAGAISGAAPWTGLHRTRCAARLSWARLWICERPNTS